MNTTATAKIALAALAAPALAALAIGLAGHASAESTGTALDTVQGFKDQGYQVIVNKDGTAPLDQCTVIASRQDRRQHHGGPQRNQYITVVVDAYCPNA